MVVYLLLLVCELITTIFYSIRIGYLTPTVIITNSIITIILFGVAISLTNAAVFEHTIHYSVIEYMMEGIKEYVLSFYYIVLSLISISIFALPVGLINHLNLIRRYLAQMNINETLFTIHELLVQMPVSMRIDISHNLQISVLMAILIFVFFLSCSFIGKIVLVKTDNLLSAFDLRIIFRIIKNIGIMRYLRFFILMTIILVVLFNVIVLLDYYFYDFVFSALFESLLLFFSTKAFCLITMNK